MKKDKEWLKEQVAHEQNDGLYFRENYSQYDHFVNVEDLLPLIDQLDEPEINSESLVNEIHRQFNENDYWEAEDVRDMAIDVIREHNTTAKPVIPQFVADYIEIAKQDIPLLRVFDIANNVSELDKWKKEYEWIRRNSDLFARAWLYGYEVEEEKKYYVLNHKGETMLYKSFEGIVDQSRGYKLLDIAGDEKDYQFTEAEIKAIDERYWAFAEEVTSCN